MSLKHAIAAALAGLIVIGFGLGVPSLGRAAPATPAMTSQAPATTPVVSVAKQDKVAAKDDVQNYVLGTGDVISIKVLGRSDFDTKARVAQDGTIQLPYLGPVQASNRTAEKLGEEVGNLLNDKGYFSHPIMKVDIESFASRYVTVLGEVVTPGLVPIDRRYQLSEVLARVGGIRETGADYVVIRSEKGEQRQVSLQTLATGDSTQDPYVQSGDKIFVPKAALFYISGQVHSPGAYPIETDMTLRMAIGRGGGLTDLGTDHGVRVTGKDGKARKIELGDKIEPGDVIVIGEKLF